MEARIAQRTSRRRPSVRDPVRTRAAILAAATAEFASKGLKGARVDTIARRAGANKRMIYHYFADKEGLYLAALEATYAAIRTAEIGLRFHRSGSGRRHACADRVHLELFHWPPGVLEPARNREPQPRRISEKVTPHSRAAFAASA
jgi:AcrR family transcriptional regulator